MANTEENTNKITPQVIIIGGGLAGLVATYELSLRHIPCIIVDQENEKSLGGQSFWSLGGLFCVNSSDQRRYSVKDSRELAWQDWMSSAAFDREREDHWPRQWAKAFVDFATDEFEAYVKGLGLKFANVGWAERGEGRAGGHGNSVPRFHLTWGTGPEVLRIFRDPVLKAAKKGLVQFRFRHRVDDLIVNENTGAVTGVRGKVLEPTDADRGVATSRTTVGDFELHARAVLISSGGIGGNVEIVKKNWPVDRFGSKVPEHFVIGVPAYVDGRMLGIAENRGANVINRDRMWLYTEGLKNWHPIWPKHGIRVLPGPSSLWFDANGNRLPQFLYPGCDTLATLKYICGTGYDYTWFILNRSIITREFALSGSEQNPDLTGKSLWGLLRRVLGNAPTVPVQNFMNNGEDFVVRNTLEELIEGMNELVSKSRGIPVDLKRIKEQIEARDIQLNNHYTKDSQLMLMQNARQYFPDRLARVVKPHKILDPSHGPLIAVRLNLLTRKTLGGIETNLSSNVMRPDGSPFSGLYAAGEVAGFGGGGVHGYKSLEGTFLGGCIFSGRSAGRAMADFCEEKSGSAG